MKVRGAPAIAIVGVLSVALQLKREIRSLSDSQEDKSERRPNGELSYGAGERLRHLVCERFDFLKTARPTAVNIAEAAERFKLRVNEVTQLTPPPSDARDSNCTPCIGLKAAFEKLIYEMESMLAEDISANKTIGKHGADHILSTVASEEERVTILTHCNTGSLATGGYGTALGVVRSLHEAGKLAHVYCTETRPYNQGARLTAYELVHDAIPSTLICDSTAALLMGERKVTAVVVGADRVVRNGDTANKIGLW